MPTKSYGHFIKNMETVNRLKDTYESLRSNRGTRGRAAWDHITRSSIIFLVASYEVYIEDVIKEACNQQIVFNRDARTLPNSVKNTINDYVKKDSNGAPPIELCDEGWKCIYRRITCEKTDKLNTPKQNQIIELFTKLVGIPESSISSITCLGGVDELISFRGSIAHRVKASAYVTIEQVIDNENIVRDAVKALDIMILNYFRNQYSGRRLPWNNTYG